MRTDQTDPIDAKALPTEREDALDRNVARDQRGATEVPGEATANTSLSPLVSMSSVSKRFDAVTAVDDVDFGLRPGEVHALVGENGAGKSTLMKILAGIYRPDNGRVEMAGTAVNFKSPHDAEAAGIAMIPQELELFGELTVAENLFVGRARPRRAWGGFDWAAMRASARQVFDSLGVDLDVGTLVKRLSVANGQLVAIARALIGDARVVVMDEPTAALTGHEADRLFQVVRDLTSQGVGVVYISHRLEEILRISDRVTVMRDGRHIRTDAASNLTPGTLVSLMVGRELDQFFARDHAVSGEVVLELRDLGRQGSFESVNLTVRRGEVVGLAGLIGAGRTEVAQAIFGIAPATSGEIYLNGQLARIRGPEDAFQHGLAYVPEERRSQGLILQFSGIRNITFSSLSNLSRFGFVDSRAERRVAERLAKDLSIKGAPLSAPVTRFSGGNQQKIVVAKSLVQDPSLLILDEPTRGVDVGAKSDIYRLIDELAREGKAVLLISSELVEILSMSDRIYVMRDGRVAGAFGHDEATEENVLAVAAGASTNEPGDVP